MVTITRSTQWIIGADCGQFRVSAEPVEWIDPVFIPDGTGMIVRYAVVDDSPSDYEWGDVRFWQADPRYISPSDRDEVEACDHVFLVERYEHGLVRYALMGESSAVDRQWDVSAPVGLIGLPSDFTDPEEAARAYLAEYTEWCNGEVYGVIEERFERDGAFWIHAEVDSCWGFIGTKYTEQVVKEGI